MASTNPGPSCTPRLKFIFDSSLDWLDEVGRDYQCWLLHRHSAWCL